MAGILNIVGENGILKTLSGLTRAYIQQQKTLRKLLLKAGDTQYGKQFRFSDILFSEHLVQEFQKNVPISSYSDIYTWWQRAYNGEESVTWPGKIKYFALSSGTTEGASKYIPVSKQMVKAITKSSIRQLVYIGRNRNIPKECFTKHFLMIGGSTDLNFNGINFSGDLSGITTSNVPALFQGLAKPDPEIRAKKSWDEKIDSIIQEAHNWDVSVVAGVPAWIQIVFEKIIDHYKLNHIHEIWPNLHVYLWGGVSIEPYKKSISDLCGRPIQYWETYLASEGFFAFQSSQNAKGMRLICNNGIFFEFIPFNSENFDEDGNLRKNPLVCSLKDVKLNIQYALIISTCSGAWRYMIGDTVEFVNIRQPEIKITGRIKHFLSICGEHLSVENMNTAIMETSSHFGMTSNEFTVAGIQLNGRHAHEWFVGTNTESVDEKIYKKYLDDILCKLNDDYAVERKHALSEVIVHIIPNTYFNEFLKIKGKQGSQTKFPRVLSSGWFSDWKEFLTKHK